MSNLGFGALFVKVEADVRPALSNLAILKAEAERVGRTINRAVAQAQIGGGATSKGPTVTPQVQTGPLDQLRSQVDSLTGAIRNVRVVATADTSQAVAQLGQVEAEIQALSGRVAAVTIDTNDAAAVADLTELQTRLAALEARRVQLKVELAGGAASPTSELAALGAQIDALRARTARVKITTDGTQAETEIAAIRAQLDQLSAGVRNVRVDVNDAGLVAKVERAKTQIAQLEAELRKLETGGGATVAVKAPKAVFEGIPQQARKAAQESQGQFDSVFKAIRGNANREIGGGLREATREISGAFASLGAARSGNVFYAISGALNVATNTAIAFARAGQNVVTTVGNLASTGSLAGGVIGGVFALGMVAATVAAAGLIYKLTTLAAQATAVAGTLAVVGKEGISLGTQFEETFVAFRATLGDFGTQELDFLKSISVESGKYDFLGLQQLDRAFLAYGVLDDELRRGLLQTLITLGTVQGKSADQLQFAANALGQVFQFGKLRGAEVLQLVQSLGVSAAVLKNLPEYADQTTGALMEMSSDGLIPATKFFEALQLEAAKYGDVVEQANQTVVGKLSRLKESFSINLGEAFFKQGVQSEIAGVLDKFIAIFESIDFGPVAAGFRQVFEAINAGLGNVTGPGGVGNVIKTFFEETLPAALENAARAAYFVTSILRVMFGDFVNGTNQAQGPLSWLIDAMSYLAQAVTMVVFAFQSMWEITKTVFGTLGDVGSVLVNVTDGLIRLSRGDISGASAAASSAVGNIASAIDRGTSSGIRFSTMGTTLVRRLAEIANARDRAKSFEFKPFEGLDMPNRERPTGNDPGLGTDDAAKKLAEKIAKLRDELFDLTERWNGYRSELDKGLFGDKGFEATADQIKAIGKRVDGILIGIGQSGVAAAVRAQVRTLVALADERVALAEKIKSGEQALADAVRARDDFASKVRQQAIDFVNALRLEEESVDAFTRVSGGGVAGYIVTRTKQFKSFLDQQRDRLAQLKQFAGRIARMSAAGLDSNLLQSLVGAGPEQAGEVVKQLDEGGAAAISEVNAIQRELGATAERLGTSTARQFYGAGVDQAQAWLDGLKSRQSQISVQAKVISDSIYAAVLPFAKEMQDLGVATGTAIGTGIAAGAKVGSNAVVSELVASTKRIFEYAKVISRLGPQIQAIETRAMQIQTSNGFLGNTLANTYRAGAYANLNAQLALSGAGVVAGDTSVSVYIGGQKIDEIVRTEVTKAARNTTTGAVAGGRR